MAEFQFENPDGKKYAVQAPDLDTAIAAFERMDAAVTPLDSANRKAGFIPFLATDEKGDLKFDVTAGFPARLPEIPEAVGKAVLSGVTAPGDVMSGELTPDDPEFQQRIWDTGALMTGINPGVASGQRLIPGVASRVKSARPKVPTAQELKAAAGAGYKAAESMGVDYATASVKELADDIARQLETKGIREKRAPSTFSLFDEISAGPDDSVVSLTGLREIRAALNDIAGDFGPSNPKSDRKAAQDAIRAVDEFMQEPPVAGVVDRAGVGDGGAPRAGAGQERAREAAAAIKDANANYAAASRSDTVTGKIQKAELDADAANSGKNLDNRTRQLLKAIIDPERPRNRRGYSKEELALIDDIVRGKHGADLARDLGNLLGGGGGLGQTIPMLGAAGLGLQAAGPLGLMVGAIPPLAGRGLRAAANKITASQAKKLDELIRKRSPLYQGRQANPQRYLPYPVTEDIIMRALMPAVPSIAGDMVGQGREMMEGLRRRY